MKAKWEIWQVGWESEQHEVELDIDEDECPACASSKPVSDMDPIIIGYRKLRGHEDETKYRLMEAVEVVPGLVGWMCREATREEIASEKEKAKLVREGLISEVSREEILAQSMADDIARDAVQKSFTDALEMLIDPVSWAAKYGARLGEEAQKKKKMV
jgi:hypothetical protein